MVIRLQPTKIHSLDWEVLRDFFVIPCWPFWMLPYAPKWCRIIERQRNLEGIMSSFSVCTMMFIFFSAIHMLELGELKIFFIFLKSGGALWLLTLDLRGPNYNVVQHSKYHGCWYHQQPWYWQCRIGKSLFYLRKDFSYLSHVNVEQWHEM